VNDNGRTIVQAFSKTDYVEEWAGTLRFLSGEREPLLVWKQAKKAAAPSRSLRTSMFPPIGSHPIPQVEELSFKESIGP